MKANSPFFFGCLLLLFTTVNLDAQCVQGDCQYGYGKFLFKNGDVYIGDFYEGKANGQGIVLYKDGQKYVGSWKDGKIEGEGRVYIGGDCIEQGIWKDNQLVEKTTFGCLFGDCDNGVGTLLMKNGTKYIGKFKNGTPVQQGVVVYLDGEKYVGEWSNWQRNGTGTLYQVDGTIESGTWKNDALVETKKLFGCVEGDCKNGVGVYVYNDYTRYEGEFKNAIAYGKGVCFYSNGEIYEGTWLHHTFNGKGTLYENSGQVQSGTWKNGQFIGKENTGGK